MPKKIMISYVMLCVIWYHLYNLKNVKNTNEGVLLLEKWQAKAYGFYYGNGEIHRIRTFLPFLSKTSCQKNTAWDPLGPIPHCLSSMITLSEETYKYFGPDRKNVVFSFLNNILF